MIKSHRKRLRNNLIVVVCPCDFESILLNEYQTVNPLNQPLGGMSKHDQEMLFVKLADTIDKKLSQINEI